MKRMTPAFFTAFLVMFIILAQGMPAQGSLTLSLWSDPSVFLPLGPVDEDGDALYSLGGGGSLGVCISPSRLPFLLADAQIGEDVLAVNFLNEPMSVTRIGAGLGFSIKPSIFETRVQAHGGYYFASYGGDTGSNAYYDASLSLIFKLSTAFGVGLTGGWRDYLNLGGESGPSLARGAFAGIGLSLYPAELRARTRIEFKEILIHPLYPILMKHYDASPVGRVVFVNQESQDISDVKIYFFIPGYMDGPTLCAEIPLVRKGQSATVDLKALLNANVLKITESVLNRAEIRVDYKVLDKSAQASKADSTRILDRNAMSWDDDRKAAAFITAKDPDVLSYAKTLGSAAQASRSLYGDRALRAAIGIFESLDAAGIRYVQDPKSPYAAIDKGKNPVDYLQFPAQTLAYKSGDCDDLSALYASLLEAIGVETALITVPGHIFVAFALDMSEAEARGFFSAPNTYIVRDGKAWMPVEITMIGKGFTQAWRQGAREWTEARGQASEGFFPVHEAWAAYEPVGIVEGMRAPPPPDAGSQGARWAREWNRFAELEMGPREQDLAKRMEKAGMTEKARLQNRLGVLYARFGMNDKATVQFTAASVAGLSSAATNLASVYVIQEKHKEAYEVLGRTLKTDPDNQGALVAYVQAARRLGKTVEADGALLKLKRQNAALAAKLSTDQGGPGRAAETQVLSVWMEE